MHLDKILFNINNLHFIEIDPFFLVVSYQKYHFACWNISLTDLNGDIYKQRDSSDLFLTQKVLNPELPASNTLISSQCKVSSGREKTFLKLNVAQSYVFVWWPLLSKVIIFSFQASVNRPFCCIFWVWLWQVALVAPAWIRVFKLFSYAERIFSSFSAHLFC